MIYVSPPLLCFNCFSKSSLKFQPLLPEGVRINSVPEFNHEGVIKTELENTVSLVCQPEGGHETEEELVWLRNDAAVRLQEGNTKGSSKVCVTPVYEDHGATFTCHLRKNATVSASVTLDVTCKSVTNVICC